MLYTLEQLDLKRLLLALHNVDSSIPEVVGESVVDFCAGTGTAALSDKVSITPSSNTALLTLQIIKMRLLQESRMRKGTSSTNS